MEAGTRTHKGKGNLKDLLCGRLTVTATHLDRSLIFFPLIQETKVEFGIHKFPGGARV